MISTPTALWVYAHAMPCLPKLAGLWHPLAQIPPSGVIHRALDVVGVVFFVGVAAWLVCRKRAGREDLRTPMEWEILTGVQVLDYAEWRREGIGLEEPITLAEFDRLAKASASIHRTDRTPFTP
ncbi:MAG: hypothetical protein E6Q97_38755 [Desulfurellales bacterium]|nr:MAG: hypothetical protein E6Q97_38755 [Desulfurellales bacterium]